jgi:hypothetical protein
VDDVVLVKNKTAAAVEFQRGRFMEAIPRDDGHVRSVEYRNLVKRCSGAYCTPYRRLQ